MNKPCQYCLAEAQWPVCQACNTRLTRFMALVGNLTHFQIPRIRIPRLIDSPVPGPEGPCGPRERKRELTASNESGF